MRCQVHIQTTTNSTLCMNVHGIDKLCASVPQAARLYMAMAGCAALAVGNS